MKYDNFEYFEMNILENEKLISSSDSEELYKPSQQAQSTTTLATTSSSSSTASGFASAMAGSVPAVAVVTVLVTVMSSFLLNVPNVNLIDYNINHEEVSLTIELDESNNPYFASLLKNNEVLETIEVDSNVEFVFTNLDYETNYLIIIENDYGIGLNKVKEFEITTSSQPVYPNGKLRIDDLTNINYALKELNLYFDLNDEHHYLSNFKVVVSDDINNYEESVNNLDNSLKISLEEFNRGYLTITVYGYSSHPQSGLNIVLTTYKIYY